jgi:hypothetical protein
MKHFVGSYSITGMLIMLLRAVTEKEIYIPSSAVIAESGTEPNTHFFDHTFSPGTGGPLKPDFGLSGNDDLFIRHTPA